MTFQKKTQKNLTGFILRLLRRSQPSKNASETTLRRTWLRLEFFETVNVLSYSKSLLLLNLAKTTSKKVFPSSGLSTFARPSKNWESDFQTPEWLTAPPTQSETVNDTLTSFKIIRAGS